MVGAALATCHGGHYHGDLDHMIPTMSITMGKMMVGAALAIGALGNQIGCAATVVPRKDWGSARMKNAFDRKPGRRSALEDFRPAMSTMGMMMIMTILAIGQIGVQIRCAPFVARGMSRRIQRMEYHMGSARMKSAFDQRARRRRALAESKPRGRQARGRWRRGHCRRHHHHQSYYCGRNVLCCGHHHSVTCLPLRKCGQYQGRRRRRRFRTQPRRRRRKSKRLSKKSSTSNTSNMRSSSMNKRLSKSGSRPRSRRSSKRRMRTT